MSKMFRGFKLAVAAAIAFPFAAEPQAQTFQIPSWFCDGFSRSECNRRQREMQTLMREHAEDLKRLEDTNASTECLEREMTRVGKMRRGSVEDEAEHSRAWSETLDLCKLEETLDVNKARSESAVRTHLRKIEQAPSRDAVTEALRGMTARVLELRDRRLSATRRTAAAAAAVTARSNLQFGDEQSRL